jgi:cytochrome P450
MPMPASLPVPGPKGSFIWGNLPEFGRAPLSFLERCVRDHGDFVQLRFANRHVLLLNDPLLIELVLGGNIRSFRKTLGYRTPFMRRMFGQGLLTSEGDFWMRQRRLAQPAFHRERIAAYADIIARSTGEMLDRWPAGRRFNVQVEMMELTTRVVTRCLFNADVPQEINDLGKASEAVMSRFSGQFSAWAMITMLLPTPGKWRFERVMRNLDDFIFQVIRERRVGGRDEGDLLSMLLQARDEDGSQMTDQQLRDELTTLMLAGIDTTALALSWAFYLLARHPEMDGRLAAEVAGVLGNRAPAFADLPKLRFTEWVIKESMRLYSPAWIIGREAVKDVDLAGYKVRPGTSLIMSQWLKHRDARWFPEPSAFRPERWGEPATQSLPKYAYFPFAGGPRICIGWQFAMMEAVLALAGVIQRFRLTCDADYEVKPWPSITLQPRDGIWLTAQARKTAPNKSEEPHATGSASHRTR